MGEECMGGSSEGYQSLLEPSSNGSPRPVWMRSLATLAVLAVCTTTLGLLWLAAAVPFREGRATVFNDAERSSLRATTATSLAETSVPQQQSTSSLGYIQRGYNIYVGNPLAFGTDPGFCGVELFTTELATEDWWAPNGLNIDHPEGTALQDVSACSLDLHAQEFWSVAGLTNALLAMVGLDSQNRSGAFLWNPEYQQWKQQLSENSRKMFLTTQECIAFKVVNLPQRKLSDSFLQLVAELPSAYGDGQAYFEFVQIVGFHYLKELTLGARVVHSAIVAEKDITDAQKKGLENLEGGGQGNVPIVGDSVSIPDKLMADHSVGPAPPSLDWVREQWLERVRSDPRPVQFKLGNIADLVRRSGDWDAAVKAENLETLNYCRDALGFRKKDCAVPEDPKLECVWDSDCSFKTWCREGRCQFLWQEFHLRQPSAFGVQGLDACYSEQRTCVGAALSLKECMAAAAAADKVFQNEISLAVWPTGCWIYDGEIFFNHGQNGDFQYADVPLSLWPSYYRDFWRISDDSFGGMPLFVGQGSIWIYCPSDTGGQWVLRLLDSATDHQIIIADDEHCDWGVAVVKRDRFLFQMDGHSNKTGIEAKDMRAPRAKHQPVLSQYQPLPVVESSCKHLQTSGFPGGTGYSWMNTCWHRYHKGFDQPLTVKTTAVYQDSRDLSNYLYFCEDQKNWVITNSSHDVKYAQEHLFCDGLAFSHDFGLLGGLWTVKSGSPRHSLPTVECLDSPCHN